MADSSFSPADVLRFRCGGCGNELEVPAEHAGVEGPCPLCQAWIKAPSAAAFASPPVPKVSQGLPEGFWDQPEIPAPPLAHPAPAGPGEPGSAPGILREIAAGAAGGAPVSAGSGGMQEGEDGFEGRILPPPADVPESQESGAPDFPENDADLLRGSRQRARRLRIFDAALIAFFVALLAVGGAAVAFTQARPDPVVPPPPELSAMVVERMQQIDRQRDQAVQGARRTLQDLLGAGNAVQAGMLDMTPGGHALDRLQFPLFPGSAPEDFEFIQARRLPGTERFLSVFEIAADPPVVIPVEETPAGPRIHGAALVQQMSGRLASFLGAQGQEESVFYVMLRPAPGPMEAEFRRSRPDLAPFRLVAVEPAFPADGASGCLAALAPDTLTDRIFARRAHDSGLRPAVVQLAWRQHRETGAYVELTAFQPNAWSRH